MEIILNLAMLIFSIAMLIVAFFLPSASRFGMAGANFWPQIILGLMFVAALMVTLQSLKERPKPKADVAERKPFKYHAFLFAVILCIFPIIWKYMGTITAIFIWMILVPSLFKEDVSNREKWVRIGLGASTIVCIIFIFSTWLGVPLPKGISIFKLFNEIFYY